MKRKHRKQIIDLQEKYFNLVWVARRPPVEDEGYWSSLSPDTRKKAMVAVFEIEHKFPEECAALTDPEHGDWQHGFDSGMLAGLRYVLSLTEYGKKQADFEFPMLDT